VQQFLENPNRYSSPKKSKPGSTPQNAIVISESPARDRSVFEAFRDLQEESIELARSTVVSFFQSCTKESSG